MMKQQWKYKVGGRPQGLIPTLILLAVFAGLSVWLHVAQNGAALFTIILSIFMFVILLVVIYRAVFVKILIFEDGFFHQTKPGNGKYYSYGQIKKHGRVQEKSHMERTVIFAVLKLSVGR